MTITLKPETARAVAEAAARRGITAEAVVEETLAREWLPAPAEQADERETRKQEALARFTSGYHARQLGPSALLQDKAEERAARKESVL